jgi:hypothetical protein
MALVKTVAPPKLSLKEAAKLEPVNTLTPCQVVHSHLYLTNRNTNCRDSKIASRDALATRTNYPPPTNTGGRQMTFSKNKFNQGNDILFVSLMALIFAPEPYKLPGLGILYVALITAAVIDCKKNTKRVRRITRRVASCSCAKARATISHIQVPQIFQISCTVCGTPAT